MKQYSTDSPTNKLKGLTIKKNELVGIDDHVVYGRVDDYPFEWHFYSKKSGRTEDVHFEQVKQVELSGGIVTVTFTTGRKPLVYTKGGIKLKAPDQAQELEVKPAPDQAQELPDEDDYSSSEEPLEASTDPAPKKADYMPIIGDGLDFKQNKTFPNQYDLMDEDGFCYAHLSNYDHVLHFEKWNGNFPKHGKIVTKIDEIESVALTSDPSDRTIKVSYLSGYDGYFLGSVPKSSFEIVEENKLQPTPSRANVDTLLKQYFKGRLALRDYTPSIKVNDEWVRYAPSKHLRLLLSESDEVIRQAYANVLSEKEFANFHYQIPRGEFPDLLSMLFNEEPQDTFMEWVKSKPWDGIDRERDLHKAIGLSSTPFNEQPIVSADDDDHYCRAIVHMILVGAIQRHIKPFIQQYVPVLVGLQGSGKTSTLMALGGCFTDETKGWYFGFTGSLNPDHNGREFYRPQLGKAVVELMEIDSLLKKDTTSFIKQFLSKAYAEYNEKNEKSMTEKPLTAFITGTTNYERFLVDNSGNRRFVIVYMSQQTDTPNREALKDVDRFRYTNDPLFLSYHPEYVQQLYAQAYEEYLDGETYDFYVDRNSEADIVTKVQNKLNLLALKEPENMDLLVGFMCAKCEENYQNVCVWTDVKRNFADENKDIITKFQLETLFKSFKENPKRFGFSEYGAHRLGFGNEEKIIKGFKLVDKKICEEFTKKYSDIVE